MNDENLESKALCKVHQCHECTFCSNWALFCCRHAAEHLLVTYYDTNNWSGILYSSFITWSSTADEKGPRRDTKLLPCKVWWRHSRPATSSQTKVQDLSRQKRYKPQWMMILQEKLEPTNCPRGFKGTLVTLNHTLIDSHKWCQLWAETAEIGLWEPLMSRYSLSLVEEHSRPGAVMMFMDRSVKVRVKSVQSSVGRYCTGHVCSVGWWGLLGWV